MTSPVSRLTIIMPVNSKGTWPHDHEDDRAVRFDPDEVNSNGLNRTWLSPVAVTPGQQPL
jgi:hypothetical protein